MADFETDTDLCFSVPECKADIKDETTVAVSELGAN